jgi:hypothetical protein
VKLIAVSTGSSFVYIITSKVERIFMYWSVPLCTFQFFLISNKFCNGGSSAVMLLNRTSAVMILNRTGGGWYGP